MGRSVQRKITHKDLRIWFDYHPDGFLIEKLYQRSKFGPKKTPGQRLYGTKKDNGYLKTTIYGRHCYIHRLIFFWHYGRWPNQIDHINRNKADNRIENLRDVSQSLNILNASKRKSKYGLIGVRFDKQKKKFKARIKINGHEIHLGCFHSKEEAAYAYDTAARKYIGDIVHTNFPDRMRARND